MSLSSGELPNIDDARNWVAQVCADLLNEGACQIRVRIAEPDGEQVQAWVYRRKGNRWERTSHSVEERGLAKAVRAVMQMLASHPPTESWQAHHHHTADLEDTDLRFDRESVEAHAGANMRSWTTGILFKDVRASGQDRRRATRRARPEKPPGRK